MSASDPQAGDDSTRTGRGLLWCAAAIAAVALALPESWLTGDVEAGDPRHLVRGAWILRASLVAIAALLALAHRVESRTAAPARSAAPEDRWPRLVWGLLVVAAALRAFRLDAPMWYDEIWMLLDCVRPPLDLTLRTFASDNNHPLYSFLATVSARVFGESAWTLRLPAAVFGVAGVGALFVFARGRLGTHTAFVAAAILALSAHHIGFSQNARAYTGLLFFGLVASHAFLKALETGRRSAWVCHGVCLALCVALHLTGVFFAVGHVAVLAWVAWKRPAWLAPGGIRAGLLGIALATLAAFAAYALVFPQVLDFFRPKAGKVSVKSQWSRPDWFVKETALSLGFGLVPGLALLATGALVALGGVIAAWRRMPALVLLSVVPALAMAGVMLGLGRNLWPRLFFFLAGFAVLIAVEGVLGLTRAGASRLPRADNRTSRRFELAAAGLLLAACVVMVPRAFAVPKQDYGAAKDFVESVRREGEAVVTVGMASDIYRDYYSAGYAVVETPEELARALPPGASGYVIYTFPVFVDSRMPGVWTAVQREGREVARFPAAIGGGDVVVLKIGG